MNLNRKQVKGKIIKLITSLCFLIIVLLMGCRNQLWTDEEEFPDREIVFNMWGETSGYLGFINADGKNLITRTVINTTGQAQWPTWSSDGNFIAYQKTNSPTSQRVISKDGHLFGDCDDWVWDDRRNWITSDGKLLFVRINRTLDHSEVVLGDFNNCEIEKILFRLPQTTDKAYLDSTHLSSQGLLVVSRIFSYTASSAKVEVMVVDSISKQTTVVGQGRDPVWSADGEWIAYTALDGIYIVRKDGSENRRVVEIDSRRKKDDGVGLGWYDGFPAPSWSPDGKWLTYHRLAEQGAAIYKVEVASGIETKLFEGGVFPNWRWDMFSE